MNYILIDTSYLIFYRFYALIQWWKFANSDVELGNPEDNKDFCDKFQKSMADSVKTIRKLLKLHDTKRVKHEIISFAAYDCPRLNIWRHELYSEYKGTREKDDKFMIGKFFKMVYRENLMEQAGCSHIIEEDGLEADDIVAIMKKYLRNREPDCQIYIITNDMDYLQLWDSRCDIVNLRGLRLIDKPNSYPEADKNLFIKILVGDKSDNISPVFKKCSIKEAEELYENPEKLDAKLKEEDAYEKILINKTIIDFDEIPEEYVDRVYEKLDASMLMSSPT